MRKADWIERIKSIFQNEKKVKQILGIGAVIAVVLCFLLIIPVFFPSNEGKETASDKTEANVIKDESEINAGEIAYAAAFKVTINPELKLYVDEKGIVIQVEKLNEDAETLLKNYEWADKSLEVCFQEILEAAYKEGFLRNESVVSVMAENKADMDMTVMIEELKDSAFILCKDKDIQIMLATQEGESADVVESWINKKETNDTEVKNIESKHTFPKKKATDIKSDSILLPLMADADKKEKEPYKEDEKEDTDHNENSSLPENNSPGSGNTGSASEYQLVWKDEFEGNKLNRDDWNVELHRPGWVNAEWQEYVDSEENIYVKDGNLVIQAIKTTDEKGKDYYTSGRINTQNKHDFKYGKFEARLKVPKGMGFLPAFWMMPTEEQNYGQWPKCGEIDIMEVMGQSTDTLHGTIHYGDPHGQKQGTYVIDGAKEDFAEDFHTYTCEWEPGKITWYVDGVRFHEATDWYSKREGFDEVAYPAPFDQPFYLIFNVAVGGSWVGYPDETTEFNENARMVVDYVKVYQKNQYDENVEKPAKPEVPDSEIGANLLVNGDFEKTESFADKNDWEFLTANGGTGKAQIENTGDNHVLKITTDQAGTVDYSVQLVQGPIALKHGNKYKVSFEAWADEARNMKALISAPDLNYIRYWGDQTISLTTDKQTFTYEFDMIKEGDANSRFEMTFGAMNSLAAVYIDNITVEKTGSFVIEEESKTVLPDGNYVYNSGFDTGSDRMKYWSVDSIADTKYFVTNDGGIREFKAIVPKQVSALEDVVLKQENTAVSGGKEYLFTFDAYGAEPKTIKAVIVPKAADPSNAAQMESFVFEAGLDTAKKGYEYRFTMPEGVSHADVEFLLGVSGTTCIDNVRVQENANIINGDFSNGTAGWELYAYTPGDVAFAVDEKDNGSNSSAAAVAISKTGAEDWHIQLKQLVTLEQGKKYRISFDTWSTVPRDFLFAIQRNKDKKGDGEWTSYSGDIKENMSTNGFKHYEQEFDMIWETDDIAEVKFSLGAVNGTVINTPHTVFVDNVKLEEIGTCDVPELPEVKPVTVNLSDISLIKTKDAAGNAVTETENLVNANWTGSAGFVTEGATVKSTVSDPGKNPWDVQLQQFGIPLEAECEYKLTFKGSADAEKLVQAGLQQNGGSYTVYSLMEGQNIAVRLSETEKSYTIVFKMNEAGDENATLFFNMGSMTDENAGYLLSPDGEESKVPENPEEGGEPPVKAEGELIINGDFLKGKENWAVNINSPASAAADVENGKMIYDISNIGTDNWHLQLAQSDLKIEQGASYHVSFTIKSSIGRPIKWAVMEDGNKTGSWNLWYNGGVTELDADVEKTITADFTANASCNEAMFQITLAPDADMALQELMNNPVSHKIEIDNVSVIKVSDAAAITEYSLLSGDETKEMVIEETSAAEETTATEETTAAEETTATEETTVTELE